MSTRPATIYVAQPREPGSGQRDAITTSTILPLRTASSVRGRAEALEAEQ